MIKIDFKIKCVYIASPYTLGDVAENVRAHLAAADAIAAAGLIPYAPLLNHLWELISPKPYDFWTRIDMEWVRRCDALVRLPGESAGADAEVREAERLAIPVFRGLEDLYAEILVDPEAFDI